MALCVSECRQDRAKAWTVIFRSVASQFAGPRCSTRVIGRDSKDLRALAYFFQRTEEKISELIGGKLAVWAALSAIESH